MGSRTGENEGQNGHGAAAQTDYGLGFGADHLTRPRVWSCVTSLGHDKSWQRAGTGYAGNQTLGKRLDASGAYF